MPKRSGLLVAGLLGMLVLAGSRNGAAQAVNAAPSPPRAFQETGADRIPEPAIMAVLATSLVGLFLAGLQKRRRG